MPPSALLAVRWCFVGVTDDGEPSTQHVAGCVLHDCLSFWGEVVDVEDEVGWGGIGGWRTCSVELRFKIKKEAGGLGRYG